MTDATDNGADDLSFLRAYLTERTNELEMAVDKLLEGRERINALDARAKNLAASSQHYRRSARRMQRQMKWLYYRLIAIISNVIRLLWTSWTNFSF